MNLQNKIQQLKRQQGNYVGIWDEYDRLGEIIEALERIED